MAAFVHEIFVMFAKDANCDIDSINYAFSSFLSKYIGSSRRPVIKKNNYPEIGVTFDIYDFGKMEWDDYEVVYSFFIRYGVDEKNIVRYMSFTDMLSVTTKLLNDTDFVDRMIMEGLTSCSVQKAIWLVDPLEDSFSAVFSGDLTKERVNKVYEL